LQVAVVLSNPFGRDDADFPIDQWVVQLRGVALLVHPDNRECLRPVPAAPRKEQEDEEEDNDMDDGAGGQGGDGGIGHGHEGVDEDAGVDDSGI